MMFSFRAVEADATTTAALGITARYRYSISLGVKADGRRIFPAVLVDTGADDVIFRLEDARTIGLDLSGAPEIVHAVANGGKQRVRFAEVELTLAATVTHFVRWRAVVGFADIPRAVLGFRGGLEFFIFTSDATNMRFGLLPNLRMPVAEHRVPAPDELPA